MRKEEFSAWMEGKIKSKPISDCLSRCRKVEVTLNVDLDEEYKKDKGNELISRLQYSPADERAKKPANPAFGFKEGASIRFRFTDLRSAVNRYFKFCDEMSAKKN